MECTGVTTYWAGSNLGVVPSRHHCRVATSTMITVRLFPLLMDGNRDPGVVDSETADRAAERWMNRLKRHHRLQSLFRQQPNGSHAGRARD